MTGAWLHIRSPEVDNRQLFAETEKCSRAETNIYAHILLAKIYVHIHLSIHI